MILPKSLITVTPLSKFLAMALFIVLPIVGFILGTQYQQVLNSVKQPETIATARPTPVDETENWKTFRNKDYSFKYPIDWQIKSENETVDSTTTKTSLQSNDLTTKQINTPGITMEQVTTGSIMEVYIRNNENFKSYEQLKDFMDNKSTAFPLNYFTSSKEITVNGIKATIKTGGKPTKVALGNTFCYFFKDGITYEITFTNSGGEDTIFNQILSTFKFAP